ncbi:MAG: DUF1995 family protein [Nostocaceae cyanobacterium]|nr:DUF1995 family protein [Nostocaceae cyanobacterium]
MTGLPQSLTEAIAQAREATKAAIADGYTRLQVEILFSELKPMPVALEFLPVFEEYGDRLKVLFPDAGGAALARRDWKDVPFNITDIGTGRIPIDSKISPSDEIFFMIAPTSVEVTQVEQIALLVGERPLIMLNPRLEDLGAVGIGYASRQLRERFISTIESCYHLRPIEEEAAVRRAYPGSWEVWLKNGEDYEKIVELPKKPSGDDLDALLMKEQPLPTTPDERPSKKKSGFFNGLQRFIKALNN